MSADTLRQRFMRIGIETTPHGMRAAFRTWAAESGVPREIAEAALAHTNRDKTEDPYLRTDYFEQRRDLMQHWADYLFPPNQD